MGRTVGVPQGSTQLILEAGLFVSAGELSLDNIRVEANAPLEGLPLKTGAPEEDFEKPGPVGLSESFARWDDSSLRIVWRMATTFCA